MNRLQKTFLGIFLFLVSTHSATAHSSLFDAFIVAENELSRAFSKPFVPSSRICYDQRVMTYDDTGDDLTITAELAGFKEKDIKITVEKQETQAFLIISAQEEKNMKKEDRKNGKNKALYSNYKKRSFYRKIALRPEDDTEKITAKYKNGLLKIKVPIKEKKKEEKKVQEIKIN